MIATIEPENGNHFGHMTEWDDLQGQFYCADCEVYFD